MQDSLLKLYYLLHAELYVYGLIHAASNDAVAVTGAGPFQLVLKHVSKNFRV